MQRIFIVGCPRSGTTLVQSLLSAHPQLTGFTESHVFDKAFKPRWFGGWRIKSDELKQRLKIFCEQNNLTHQADSAETFIALLDETANAREATGWVEKTPDHVFRLKLIAQVVPGAKVVHVVRRAEGVLPSLRKASQTQGWKNVKPWWECALHWWWALWITNRYVGQAGHYVLSYEHLVADTEGEVRKLMEWLGLSWDEAVLRDYTDAAALLISDGEGWKANATETIENKNVTTQADLPWIARRAVGLTRWLTRLRSYLG